MKYAKPLPTQNEEWGFFGTSKYLVADQAEAWNTTAAFFIKNFALTPEQARDLLDATFGRHLADDLSFIEGEKTKLAISKHLEKRLADKGWRRDFENTIYKVLGVRTSALNYAPEKNPLEEIAFKFLDFETLEERKSDSHDFKEVAVWSVKAALEAAFEAGKTAAKKGA